MHFGRLTNERLSKQAAPDQTDHPVDRASAGSVRKGGLQVRSWTCAKSRTWSVSAADMHVCAREGLHEVMVRWFQDPSPKHVLATGAPPSGFLRMFRLQIRPETAGRFAFVA